MSIWLRPAKPQDILSNGAIGSTKTGFGRVICSRAADLRIAGYGVRFDKGDASDLPFVIAPRNLGVSTGPGRPVRLYGKGTMHPPRAMCAITGMRLLDGRGQLNSWFTVMSSDSEKHLAGDYSGDSASGYRSKRFESSARMRKLNAVEMAFAQSLAEMAGPDSEILDVPCGSGRFTQVFSGAKYLYSIDLSEDMLTEAENNAPSDFRGEFIQASALDIPLPADSVDLAFCMRLFHHIGDERVRAQLFSELVRVSRRWVAVSFYRTGSYRYFRKRMMGRRLSGQPVKAETFVGEAARHGLRLMSISPSGVTAFFNRSAQTLALFELDAERRGGGGE